VIPPSIDPFSAKNRQLDPPAVLTILTTVGLVRGPSMDEPVNFERRDGTAGVVRRHTTLIAGGAPPPVEAPLVLQVSRWDRLKDLPGVLEAFVTMTTEGPSDAHLMLAGPDVSAVDDDPEGAAVFAECRALRARLPAITQARVHLASIPMDDVDENAIVINALQRHAHHVVQKSLVEGFGLTVTEAMWKARPIIASRVGGIQDQIVHDRDGLLIEPHDLDGLAASMALVLQDRPLADRLGNAAHVHVRDYFLADRYLEQYADFFARMMVV
jgi:trehalose synthase